MAKRQKLRATNRRRRETKNEWKITSGKNKNEERRQKKNPQKSVKYVEGWMN